jgi:homoserine O-acetyltransferase/O-succinyltransferase
MMVRGSLHRALGVTLLASVACGSPPVQPSVVPSSEASSTSTAQARGPQTKVGAGDQRIAALGACVLESGERIEDCRVGYRTFGKLDAAKSNVVLFPTWFTGNTKTLVESVPDKLVDTNRFFLVLVDSLGNGVSSSPSNSAKQARLRFPKITIHDMVESQRRLLREVLGVEKVHTVMGISMGGMQAFEWAVSHPNEVGHIIPIVGTPQLTAQDLLLWNAELHLLDDSTTYAKGAYAGHPKIPALQELHWLMLTTPAHRNKETSRASYPAWVSTKANDSAFDWNDWHRQLEAMIAHDVARGFNGDLSAAAKQVKAKALVVVAEQDHMVNPEPSKAFAKAMDATVLAFENLCGHMLPGCEPRIEESIRKFLEGQ